jgi:hypothetical protein
VNHVLHYSRIERKLKMSAAYEPYLGVREQLCPEWQGQQPTCDAAENAFGRITNLLT